MTNNNPQLQPTWRPIEPDIDTALRDGRTPLVDLARADVPAIVLRDVYSPENCAGLIERLIQRELLYDPAGEVSEKFVTQSVPEGYFHRGKGAPRPEKPRAAAPTAKRRIDIGSSLGYRGNDRDQFFAHAAETHELFANLFDGLSNPIELIYDYLRQLAVTTRVVTAYEPDGRKYGPAIFRAHYGSYTYAPHFDSVRLREQRDDYEVYRFDHQFAGVLVLQNAHANGRTAQAIIHRQLWEPEIESHLKAKSFHAFARDNNIPNYRVDLNPGDLYFFNTRCIHEVPGVDGQLPRIVLATFIGFTENDDEIMVWS